MIAQLTPTEQAPDATPPPRRCVAVTATEGPDWSWTFTPDVPAAVRPRLAELCAEMACAMNEREALEGYALRDRDTEWDLHAAGQEQIVALAFDDALALGYRLTVVPAIGRAAERAEGRA